MQNMLQQYSQESDYFLSSDGLSPKKVTFLTESAMLSGNILHRKNEEGILCMNKDLDVRKNVEIFGADWKVCMAEKLCFVKI